jgi:hypothetical protein
MVSGRRGIAFSVRGTVAYCEQVTSSENAMYQSLTILLPSIYVFFALNHAVVAIYPYPFTVFF